MERYTEEFKHLVEDSTFALAFTLPNILAEKASIKLKNKKDQMEIKVGGAPMTQLLLLATASAEVVSRLEADKEEGEEDIDIMALFLAAFEIANEISEVRRK
ncbi:MAG: hypothetical protein IKK99_01120 [Oscillospiraceae bacterium]|nr:hypothetical protein [Oscillospiraceae bacterium]